MSSGRQKSVSAEGSGEVSYTVDIPSALAPDVHGEGAYTLYLCQITARAAGRSVSWCAPFCRLGVVGVGMMWPVLKRRVLPLAGKSTSDFRISVTYAKRYLLR